MTELCQPRSRRFPDVSSRIARKMGIVRSHVVALNVEQRVRRRASDDTSPLAAFCAALPTGSFPLPTSAIITARHTCVNGSRRTFPNA